MRFFCSSLRGIIQIYFMIFHNTDIIFAVNSIYLPPPHQKRKQIRQNYSQSDYFTHRFLCGSIQNAFLRKTHYCFFSTHKSSLFLQGKSSKKCFLLFPLALLCVYMSETYFVFAKFGNTQCLNNNKNAERQS